MKRFYPKFRISLMTFAVGLASVFMFNGSLRLVDEIPVDLPKVQSSSVIEIFAEDRILFSPFAYGCGGENIYGGKGNSAVYLAVNGQQAGINTSCHNKKNGAKRELESRISNANEILEVKEILNEKLTKGKLIVLETGKEEKWVEILKYDGKKCISTMSARTLELALEFEKWQEVQK